MLIATPKLSLITICLNADKTIRETIESVLAQRDADLEYLVIDGGSTDTTREIVESYLGCGVDYFVSESDKGIADAFNKGLAAATGDLIGFINADDQLVAGTVQYVRSFFCANAEIDVMHGDVFLYDAERFIKRMRPSRRWWHPLRLVLFNHPATFVRSHVYKKLGGFDGNFKIAMDVEIFLRWLRAGVNIHYVDKPLVIMKTGGISGAQEVNGFNEYRQALILHGYSPLIAKIQCLSKKILSFILRLGRKFFSGI